MNSRGLLARAGIIDLPVNWEPQSKYASRACLQNASIRLQNRSNALILESQASYTCNVLPNRSLRISSGLGVTIGKTNSKTARLEGSLWIQRYGDRETVCGAGAREHPEIGRASV